MATIRILGRGYYAIDTKGVKISKPTSDRIDKAFAEAHEVPVSQMTFPQARPFRPAELELAVELPPPMDEGLES